MRTSTGASYYYTTDALGSVILLTDSTQTAAATYAYDSWGQTTTSTGAQAAVNPWTYAGGYNDTNTGHTKFGARYYNPTTGRFTQPDPSAQEPNRYLYAGANPCNNTDPSGLDYGACWADGVASATFYGLTLGAITGAYLGYIGGSFLGTPWVGGPLGAVAGAVSLGVISATTGALGGAVWNTFWCIGH